MGKKSKKIFKNFSYVVLSLSFILLTAFSLFNFGFFSTFASVNFDKSKLTFNNSQISVYDNNNKIINNNLSIKNISYNQIPTNLINAFICTEDKDFFKHKGINYKRILGAFIHNLKSGKIKEGASTISQQLIKNTHLTNEKTLKRKINEILLTQQLEKTLSKKEIFTSYLNAIYFGSGAFGINQASQRYFSANVEDLTLTQCATLAGIVKSPYSYSPISKPEQCLKRRNFILNQMYKDKKITQEELNNSKNEPLNLKINTSFLGDNNYYSASVNEACNILNTTEKDLMIKGYKIYTYADESLQKILDEEKNNLKEYTNKTDCDMAVICIDNKNGGITAFSGKSDFDVLNLKRQPGSILKPIISYVPGFEYNVVSPLLPIYDEKINLNGYSPKNYNNVYHGWISVKESLAKSLNIPSIKILDFIGINRAKNFASKLNINLSKDDNGYSIALGGLTNGLKIKDVTNAYQAFANEGKYVKSSFIKEIRTKNNKLIYRNNSTQNQVMKPSTAYLINDCLQESVKNGTCRKLNIGKQCIASKTGTVGCKNSKNNTDVWNISYTPKQTIGIWFGSTKNNEYLPQSLTGASGPTKMAQQIYKKLKEDKTTFTMPETIKEVELDSIDYYKNNVVKLADNSSPERFKIKGLFAVDNIPKETTKTFTDLPKLTVSAIKTSDKEIKISFNTNKHLQYELIREDNFNKSTLISINNKSGQFEYIDDNLKPNTIYCYYVIEKFNDTIINSNNFDNLKSIVSNKVKMYVA